MKTNNKLREACANIAEYARSAMCHTTDAHVLGYLNQIEGWAKAALAAPVRNYEVGTVAEQSRRFDKVCSYRFTGNCAGCQNPLDDSAVNGVSDCALFWAQIPYKKGGAK